MPEVLFVCVHNAGRSQMAAGLMRHRSAGKRAGPLGRLRSRRGDQPGRRRGDGRARYRPDEEYPKPLTDEVVRAADAVVTMGCGDACPIYPGKRYLDWELADPAGQDLRPCARSGTRSTRAWRTLLAELAPRRDSHGSAPPGRGARYVRARLLRRRRDHGRGETGAFGQLGIALAFGLAIMTMIYALGHVSGAHFNPAVSFGFALTRHFPWRNACRRLLGGAGAGAILAALLLRARSATWRTSAPRFLRLRPAVLPLGGRAHLLPHARDHGRGHRHAGGGEAAAIAVGGTVGLCALVGGPISGASMNPARSLGPASSPGELDSLWIYLLAPLVGASLGAFAYQLLRGSPGRSAAPRRRCGDGDLGVSPPAARLDDRAVDPVLDLVGEGDGDVVEAGGRRTLSRTRPC